MKIVKRSKHFLYGNYSFFAPDGKLLFRSSEKRAKWYLDRNLAKIIDNNPKMIKLNFFPKGDGDSERLLRYVRINRCVVCGSTEGDTLTKHHIVPKEFRKHFPHSYKSRRSIFLVMICESCHALYECHANTLKKELYNRFDIKRLHLHRRKILNGLNALLNNSDFMGEERISNICKTCNELLLTIGSDLRVDGNLSKAQLKDVYNKISATDYDISEKIANNVTDIYSFEKMWLNHFVQHTNPQYLDDIYREILDGSYEAKAIF